MATSERSFDYSDTGNVSRPVSTNLSLFQFNPRTWMTFILVLSDSIGLLLAFLIAANIRLGDYDPLDSYTDYLWIPVLLLIVIYASSNLYPGIGMSSVEEMRRVTMSTSLQFLIVIALTFLLKTTQNYSRMVFFLAWIIALFMIPLIRSLVKAICIRFNAWGEPVAIVGFPDRRLTEVADFFIKNPRKGIVPKVVVVDEVDRVDRSRPYRILTAQNIAELPNRMRIKTALVVVPNWNWVGENIDKYRYTFARVILIRQQRDNFSLTDSVALDFNGVTGFQVHHNLLDPWAMLFKRIIDILIAGVVLIFISPFLAVISLIIHFDSPGPIFYRQNRVGKCGKTFKLLKFRTMYINGDEIFEARLKEDKEFREEWKKFQKIKKDPRITRVGAFLRRFSIDELPQLWNIMIGDMSVVGPRPFMLNQKDMYGLAFHDYSQVRPGVTGLWQVSGRNTTTFARRAEFDMEYIQRWSIWLDLYIILRTFREVISRDGAY